MLHQRHWHLLFGSGAAILVPGQQHCCGRRQFEELCDSLQTNLDTAQTSSCILTVWPRGDQA